MNAPNETWSNILLFVQPLLAPVSTPPSLVWQLQERFRPDDSGWRDLYNCMLVSKRMAVSSMLQKPSGERCADTSQDLARPFFMARVLLRTEGDFRRLGELLKFWPEDFRLRVTHLELGSGLGGDSTALRWYLGFFVQRLPGLLHLDLGGNQMASSQALIVIAAFTPRLRSLVGFIMTDADYLPLIIALRTLSPTLTHLACLDASVKTKVHPFVTAPLLLPGVTSLQLSTVGKDVSPPRPSWLAEVIRATWELPALRVVALGLGACSETGWTRSGRVGGAWKLRTGYMYEHLHESVCRHNTFVKLGSAAHHDTIGIRVLGEPHTPLPNMFSQALQQRSAPAVAIRAVVVILPPNASPSSIDPEDQLLLQQYLTLDVFPGLTKLYYLIEGEDRDMYPLSVWSCCPRSFLQLKDLVQLSRHAGRLPEEGRRGHLPLSGDGSAVRRRDFPERHFRALMSLSLSPSPAKRRQRSVN